LNNFHFLISGDEDDDDDDGDDDDDDQHVDQYEDANCDEMEKMMVIYIYIVTA
jgi:hypothetical protein